MMADLWLICMGDEILMMTFVNILRSGTAVARRWVLFSQETNMRYILLEHKMIATQDYGIV
jgi:hypothetical protein